MFSLSASVSSQLCSLLSPCLSHRCSKVSLHLTFFCPRERIKLPLELRRSLRHEMSPDPRFSTSSPKYQKIYEALRHQLQEDSPLTTVKAVVNVVTTVVAQRTALVLEESLLEHLSNLKTVFDLCCDLSVPQSVKRIKVTSNFTLVGEGSG